MSDALKTIFGGSETETNSQASSTPINFTNSALQGLAPDLATALRSLVGSTGKIGNDANAGVGSPVPQAALTGSEGSLLETLKGQLGGGTDRASYMSDVLKGKFLPGQPGANPFFDAALRAATRPVFEGLEETLSRTLPGRFTANGQFIQSNAGDQGGSSAFDRAAAIASRGAANAAGDIAAKMGSEAYTNERGQQTEVAKINQAEVDSTIKGLQASALPRLIQQNGIEQGLALFQAQTKNLIDLLKTIGAVQAPVIANQSSSTSHGESSSDKGIFPSLFPKGL